MPAPTMTLPFEDSEYRSRVARLRALMAERGISLLLVTGPENGFYLTGFETGTPYVFLVLALPLEGEAAWIVRKTELSNVRTLAQVSWVKDGVGVTDGSDSIAVLAEKLKTMGHGRGRIGVDRRNWYFHAAYQLQLADALPEATMVDASFLVERLRMVKSPAEVACMRRAGAITAKCLRAGIETVRAGATDREIGAALTRAAVLEGSEPMSGGPFVTVGGRSFMAHSSWVGAPIRAGDIVNTEMACVVARYNTPCFRVSVVGRPSAELERFYGASEAGLEAALTKIKPGMTSAEGDRVVREAIERRGFGEYFVVRAAYSIGLAFAPGWDEMRHLEIRPNDSRLLEPGMCFHVVPALYKEGYGAVCCSMPVVVTDRGLDPLVDLEPKLFVKS
ncbi:MAG: M24 family metallopeptidase [Alphaproteobacteria bacterium]